MKYPIVILFALVMAASALGSQDGKIFMSVCENDQPVKGVEVSWSVKSLNTSFGKILKGSTAAITVPADRYQVCLSMEGRDTECSTIKVTAGTSSDVLKKI